MGLTSRTKKARLLKKSRAAETEDQRKIRIHKDSLRHKALRQKRQIDQTVIIIDSRSTSKKKKRHGDEINEMSRDYMIQQEYQLNNYENGSQNEHSEEYFQHDRINHQEILDSDGNNNRLEASFEFLDNSVTPKSATNSRDFDEQSNNNSCDRFQCNQQSAEYPLYNRMGDPCDGFQCNQQSVEYPLYDKLGHPIMDGNGNPAGTYESGGVDQNVFNRSPHLEHQQSEEYPLYDRRGHPIIDGNGNSSDIYESGGIDENAFNRSPHLEDQQSEEYPLYDGRGHPIYSGNIGTFENWENPSFSEQSMERLVNEINQHVSEFQREIWKFADIICVVCRKRCYKKQTCTLLIRHEISNILPNELKNVASLVSCLRCANLLRHFKTPPQAYWNGMHLDEIPPEIAFLSEVEKRLLSRIIPFVKMIKLSGRFGQYGFRGQAVLFAQDVCEIAEQLPLNITDAGLAFVIENRANVENNREYYVNIDNLKNALGVLKRINPLYRDVEVNFESVSLDLSEICLVSQNSTETLPEVTEQEIQPTQVEIKEIAGGRAIVRGSFHQGHSRFLEDSRGRQCTANAAVAIAATKFKDPSTWTHNFIDNLLIIGDRLYRNSIAHRNQPHPNEINAQYLNVSDLQTNMEILGNRCQFVINENFESQIHGHLQRTVDPLYYPILLNGLVKFFNSASSGIITSNGYSFAIWFQNDVFWMFDSHSRGPKGRQAQDGTACLIRLPRVESLALMLKSNIPKLNDDQINGLYSIIPLDVIIDQGVNEGLNRAGSSVSEHNLDNSAQESVRNNDSQVQLNFNNEQSYFSSDDDYGQSESSNDENSQVNDNRFSMSEPTNLINTSMLQSLDASIPAIDDVIEGVQPERSVPLFNLKRKTTAPLNFRVETRAEELCWWYLFPYGRGGLRDPERQHSITPLDYYQARIMGEDDRFHRNDYLFYALSVVEQYRAQQNVSVLLRMRQNGNEPDGLVENIFLNMRSIRGSNAYWQSALSDLLATVRNLGPPQWFITLSCNDLNWLDMRKALLIASNRPNDDPESLAFAEVQHLVEQYPVVVSRQFMVRVHAIVRFLQHHNDILGGKLVDYWWRIEFQNRGSPHLHMVCWTEGVPPFDTPEGIEFIDKIISCSLNTGDEKLDEVVSRVQIHKHTATCQKNRSNEECRFGFPKVISETTKLLGPEEAVRNKGRCFVFKRTEAEINVNTYNPKLLRIWEGNIDIQPCGNVIALAYYIAKYISKSEPIGVGHVVREAVQRAKSHGGDIGKQLYAVSNAILNQRRVSASECAFRLCHLKLRNSTRKVVFVNTCKPDERYRVLRNDGRDVHLNIFDRYVNRPDDLEEMSLAEFAICYDNAKKRNVDEDDGDADVYDTDEPQLVTRYITLKNGLQMQKRPRPAVLRTRYVTQTGDREGYFYNYLVAHVPFRNEDELLEGYENAEEAFIAQQHLLRPLQPGQNIQELRNIEQELQTVLRQIAALNIPDEQNDDVNQEEHADDVVRGMFDGRNPDMGEVEIEDNENPADQAMSEEEYHNNVRIMNVEQRQLFTTIRNRIGQELRGENHENSDNEPLKLFVTGGAGSGKTFLLKMIVQLIKRGYAPTVDPILNTCFVEVAALTGVAARLVNGRTLHSIFALDIEKGRASVYRQLNGQRLEEGRRRWRHVRWLIIDEISMVSYEILRAIHLRLQELKNNTLLFGGINILLFGDIMQLPPVRGHWCFEQPIHMGAEPHLWRFFGLCELTTNMRQRGDTDFIDLLNNLRVGELLMPQYEILLNRTGLPEINEFADGEAVRIFPTLALVSQYNNKMIEKLGSTQRMYIINARDESREAATYGQTPDPSVVSNDPNNTGGLLTSMKIAIGARVMLRSNIRVSEGLVNGSMGVVRGFEWNALRRDQLENGELPKTVFIQFDDPSIGRSFKNDSGLVGIQPFSVTYQANKGYGNVERVMLPLILSWAVTVHKLQGVTVDRGVVYLGKKLFAKGQAYVALSRVRSLEGLIVNELDQNKVFNNPHDGKALEELERLRASIRG